jgi:hypothetical protein
MCKPEFGSWDRKTLESILEHINVAYVLFERLSTAGYDQPNVAAFEHKVAQAFQAACAFEDALEENP